MNGPARSRRRADRQPRRAARRAIVDAPRVGAGYGRGSGAGSAAALRDRLAGRQRDGRVLAARSDRTCTSRSPGSRPRPRRGRSSWRPARRRSACRACPAGSPRRTGPGCCARGGGPSSAWRSARSSPPRGGEALGHARSRRSPRRGRRRVREACAESLTRASATVERVVGVRRPSSAGGRRRARPAPPGRRRRLELGVPLRGLERVVWPAAASRPGVSRPARRRRGAGPGP